MRVFAVRSPNAGVTAASSATTASSASLSQGVRRAALAVSRALEARIRALGVTRAQWQVLRVLWVEDGLIQRQLSLRVGTRESSISHALGTLERDGWVERRESGRDGRKVHIHLTAGAHGLRAEVEAVEAHVDHAAAGGLDDEEIAVTLRALAKIAKNLGPLAQPKAGSGRG